MHENKYTPKQRAVTALSWIMAVVCCVLLYFEFSSYKDLKAYSDELKKKPENVTFVSDFEQETEPVSYDYVINTGSMKIHKPECEAAEKMRQENRDYISADELEKYYALGYSDCSFCNP